MNLYFLVPDGGGVGFFVSATGFSFTGGTAGPLISCFAGGGGGVAVAGFGAGTGGFFWGWVVFSFGSLIGSSTLGY